jgi:TolA-binding protein
LPLLHVIMLLLCTELKDSYESSITDLRSQLKARTDKLNSMMEAAAQSAAQVEDLKQQLEAARDDLQELEELRELKKDIERKEKQQAAIIEGQVGSLQGRAVGGSAQGWLQLLLCTNRSPTRASYGGRNMHGP